MNKHLAAALLTASVAGAGFTGFTITSALAENDSASTADVAQVQLDEGQDQEGCNGERAQALADAIGISVDDLMAAREAGQTPAEIAEDNGVAREDLVDTLVQARQERLAEAVESGDLTQEEADEKAADIEEHVNALVDGEGGRHGRGQGGGDADDAEVDDAQVDA